MKSGQSGFKVVVGRRGLEVRFYMKITLSFGRLVYIFRVKRAFFKENT